MSEADVTEFAELLLGALSRGEPDALAKAFRYLLPAGLEHENNAAMKKVWRAALLAFARLEVDWKSGEILHVEEGLGWKRPRNWQRPAAQKESRYRFSAWLLVCEILKTRNVTKTRAFAEAARHIPVSASTIRDWFYDDIRQLERIRPATDTLLRRLSKRSGKR